mgnify:CR=1 FL=1|jgi:hypothetical protein
MNTDERLTNLEKSIDLILKKLDKINEDTQRMDSHISFIESIYSRIKTPFHYIMNLTSFSLLKNKNILMINEK